MTTLKMIEMTCQTEFGQMVHLTDNVEQLCQILSYRLEIRVKFSSDKIMKQMLTAIKCLHTQLTCFLSLMKKNKNM